MAGLLVLAHENICQISSRGRVFSTSGERSVPVFGFFVGVFFPLPFTLELPTAHHAAANNRSTSTNERGCY